MTNEIPNTTPLAQAEKEELKKPIAYSAAIAELSALDFETSKLVEGDIPENVATAVPIVAAIYHKTVGDVLEDLTEKRIEEIEEVRANDQLMYGHLNSDGSSPFDPD